MVIFQILFSLGLLGLIGFIGFNAALAIKAGTKKTQDDIDNDPRFQ